jgi:hypothetical protein
VLHELNVKYEGQESNKKRHSFFKEQLLKQRLSSLAIGHLSGILIERVPGTLSPGIK